MSSPLPPLPPLPPLQNNGPYDKNGYPNSGSLGGDVSIAIGDTLYEAFTGKISPGTQAKMEAEARKTFPGSPDVAAANVRKSVSESNASTTPNRIVVVVVGLVFLAGGIFAFRPASAIIKEIKGK